MHSPSRSSTLRSPPSSPTWRLVLLCLVSLSVLVHGEDSGSSASDASTFFQGLDENESTAGTGSSSVEETETSETISQIPTDSTTTTTTTTTVNTTLEDEIVATAIEDLEPTSSTEVFYDLPSFSLTFQVTQQHEGDDGTSSSSNDKLITFQDKLQDVIEWHLEEFFQSKLDETSSSSSNNSNNNEDIKLVLQNVGLTSNLVWREMSTGATITTTSSALTDTVVSEAVPAATAGATAALIEERSNQSSRAYEVRGTYDCDLSLILERYSINSGSSSVSDVTSSSSSELSLGVSPTLMNLFIIEAFQGENYWNLMNKFLAIQELKNIRDVDVMVSANGFKPYHPGQEYEFDDDWYNPTSDSNMSMGGIIGTAFGTVLIIAMICGTMYIFCMAPESSRLKMVIKNLIYKFEGNCEESSIVDDKGLETDDTCTNSSSGAHEAHSDDDNDVEKGHVESGWLDTWANNLTSIPLRDPKTDPRFHKKKRRGRPTVQSFVRPAQEAMSSLELDCISEADNESVTSKSTTRSTKSLSSSSSVSVKTARTSNKNNTNNQHNKKKKKKNGPRSCETITEEEHTGPSNTKSHNVVAEEEEEEDGVDNEDSSLSSGVTIWDDATSVTSSDSSFRIGI